MKRYVTKCLMVLLIYFLSPTAIFAGCDECEGSDYDHPQIYACPCGCSCSINCPCACDRGGVCCKLQPNYCDHPVCGARYWQQAHCVYKGPYESLDGDCAYAFCSGRYGVWFPEDGPLFKPFIADPRQPTYSVGWRFNDEALTKNVIPISYGDNLGLYRWCCVCPWGGQMQINIEGALWAVFDPCTESAPLINADYYVAIPVDYALGRLALRLRFYHISSHIGDEFLLNHPNFDRRNPSAEYLDGYISYYLTDEIRLYSGLGWIIQHDNSFDCGKYYAEVGTELRMPRWIGFFDRCQHLFGQPFLAMHFRWQDSYKRHIDSTFAVGYEIGKTCGMNRRIRAYLEYHDGYSVDGQFCHENTNYFAIRFTYGY